MRVGITRYLCNFLIFFFLDLFSFTENDNVHDKAHINHRSQFSALSVVSKVLEWVFKIKRKTWIIKIVI